MPRASAVPYGCRWLCILTVHAARAYRSAGMAQSTSTDADWPCAQDPDGDIARAVLQPAAEHLGQQLTAARSTLPAELHNPLNQFGGVPYFALSRRSFLGMCICIPSLLGAHVSSQCQAWV